MPANHQRNPRCKQCDKQLEGDFFGTPLCSRYCLLRYYWTIARDAGQPEWRERIEAEGRTINLGGDTHGNPRD